MIAGAGNVVIFNRIAPGECENVMRINRVEFHFSWQAQYLVRLEGGSVAPRIGNDVSAVFRISVNHEIHFAWQAQYLVRLEGDACCSAHCK